MSQYDTLLLDADGTLLDFARTEREALAATFAAHAIPLTPELERRYTVINRRLWADFEQGKIDKLAVRYGRFTQLFRENGISVDGRAFEDDYQSALGQGAYLIPGALEVVKRLSERYRLYIASNGVSATQFGRLRKTGLILYMRDVFVSEDAGAQKPDSAFFQYAFERIPNFRRERTLMVGDSLTSDIAGGANAGLDTCWYNPGGLPLTGNVQPTYVIESLEALENLEGIQCI